MGRRVRKHSDGCLDGIDLTILAALMDGVKRQELPSLREMCVATGLSPNGVHLRLNRLRRLGLIKSQMASRRRTSARATLATVRFVSATERSQR